MRRPVIKQLLLIVGVLGLFMLTFLALQEKSIYDFTLGKISTNYERSGKGHTLKIQEVRKPYVPLTREAIYHWDGLLFKEIRDEGYKQGSLYHKEKPAFYPLFPFLWKISGIDSILIIFLNFILFGIGLVLLQRSLMKSDTHANLLYLAIALLLPSAITYYLPYAESVFLLTLAVSIYGIFKKKYWIYAVGAFLFTMTRPSSLMFIAALIAADTILLFRHRDLKHYIKDLTPKLIPCVVGFLAVTGIQYLYTGSFIAYFESTELWPTESGFFNPIRDWSREGFGMSVFSIFFLALPAIIYLFVITLKSLRKDWREKPILLFNSEEDHKKEYLFLISLLFIAINLVYFSLTCGNVINGFSRYTLSVPFLYIILFLLPDKLSKVSLFKRILFFVTCLCGLTVFLSLVAYGEPHWSMKSSGLFLFLIISLFLMLEEYFNVRQKWIVLIILSLPCILWQTYLFNMYLTDAWVFT